MLTTDERIRSLNRSYRGQDKPTDVLAFSMREGEFGALSGNLLGDVVVSIPTARKQALSRKGSLIDEVTLLSAHGLLHLLGWDHATPRDDRRMRAETCRLCAEAGVSAGFLEGFMTSPFLKASPELPTVSTPRSTKIAPKK